MNHEQQVKEVIGFAIAVDPEQIDNDDELLDLTSLNGFGQAITAVEQHFGVRFPDVWDISTIGEIIEEVNEQRKVLS